ncbi:MAG: hypothetical protein V3V05_12535 [Pontiella sp.]
MSKYTVRGSSELDDKIDADLEHITRTVAPHCNAGILLGGYGRGEGTPFILSDGTQTPFNDYDLVVIVGTVNTAVRLHFNDLERQLTQEIGLPVDLCPYALSELPSREFSLLNYEMKYGHIVLWGSDDVLNAMPAYPHDAIPRFEGSRLLLNRGKLLLDIKQRLKKSDPLTAEERIRFIKFIHKARLAFGDCALLAFGQYNISYAIKRQRITDIDECPSRDAVVEGFLKAIDLKEWGNFQALADFDIAAEYRKTADLFLQFFPWYRAQHKAVECSLPKALALNLRWNGRPLPRHPRLYLYDALMELLKEGPSEFQLKQTLFSADNLVERFYLLQRRFS